MQTRPAEEIVVRPRALSAAVALTVVALGLTACSSGTVAAPVKGQSAVDASPSPSPVALPALSEEPSPVAVQSPLAVPSVVVSPTPAKPKASPKPRFAYDVVAVQRKLTDQRYYAGAIDGKPGAGLRSAVMAFQKVQDLPRNGAVGPATLAALDAPKLPVLQGTAPADRVEVDLTKQVLYIVKGGSISRIMPISSGNGATYLQKNGAKARALTPVGYYKIERRILGVRVADLGTLYDPQYFYRGWAIHGSNSVPAGPASHGCIRVSRADAKVLLEVVSVGMDVFIYGGQHTFTAGSSAPGTDTPSGDGAASTQPSPAPVPSETTSAPEPGPPATPASPAPASPAPASPSPSSEPVPSTSAEPTASPSPPFPIPG
jgi:lipoprotein-anchoring transpeptidase ErfK/SrfK